MRILQAANFVAPRSGGLRTTLDALAAGYHAAGHEVVRIVPGPRDAVDDGGVAQVVRLAAPRLPRTGGYRVIRPGRRLTTVLDRLQPERIEVSDRLTLRSLGAWGRRRGVPSVAIVHERLDALLSWWLPGRRTARVVADHRNRRLTDAFDTVVCTTTWARDEFDRIDAPSVAQVPLGVDLHLFHPVRRSPSLRRDLAPDGVPVLGLCSRLSPEKEPELGPA